VPFVLAFEHSPACTWDPSPKTSRLTKAMANVPDAITRFLIFLLLAVFRFSIVQIFIAAASVVVIAWMAEHARWPTPAP